MIDVADLNLDLFRPLVGQTFAVRYPVHEEDLTLVEAIELQDVSGHGRPAGCFRLIFDGSSTERILSQGIHRLSHAAIGTFEIAITPRADNPDGTRRYSANFY